MEVRGVNAKITLLDGTIENRECSNTRDSKKADSYNIIQIKTRLWKISRSKKFLLYMKAYSAEIVMNTLMRLNFHEDDVK